MISPNLFGGNFTMKMKISLVVLVSCLCLSALIALHAGRSESRVPDVELSTYFFEADIDGDRLLSRDEFEAFQAKMDLIRENGGRLVDAPAPSFPRIHTGDPTKSADHGPLSNPEIRDNASGSRSCGGCGGCGKH